MSRTLQTNVVEQKREQREQQIERLAVWVRSLFAFKLMVTFTGVQVCAVCRWVKFLFYFYFFVMLLLMDVNVPAV